MSKDINQSNTISGLKMQPNNDREFCKHLNVGNPKCAMSGVLSCEQGSGGHIRWGMGPSSLRKDEQQQSISYEQHTKETVTFCVLRDV